MSRLLAVHSFPGANRAVARHWEYFERAGFDKIIGISTLGHGCEWPVGIESVEIGPNSYIDGDVLPRRLIETMEWMLKQPFDEFCIAEYDVLIFKPLPKIEGIMSFRAGNQLLGAHADAFFHSPWCFDRETGTRFAAEGRAMLDTGLVKRRTHEASPDVFFGWVAQRLGIEVKQPWGQFSRNSLNCDGDLERAREAYRNGVTAIHGCKHQKELEFILGWR